MSAPTRIRVEETHEGRRLGIVLTGGKGNVIDRTMARELADTLRIGTGNRHLRAITLSAEGPHFSFGASVQEHAPETAAELLAALHDVILELYASPVPVLAAVRGACLGGGLELVLPCHRIVAAPDAKLGLPEVSLGMYAPAGSVLLPQRVRRPFAENLLLTGRVVRAPEALSEGLVDEVSDDPEAALVAWLEEAVFPHSASALRFAMASARADAIDRVRTTVRGLEKRFCEELMMTADAQEGVHSFVEKRPPVWVDA